MNILSYACIYEYYTNLRTYRTFYATFVSDKFIIIIFYLKLDTAPDIRDKNMINHFKQAILF